MQWTDSQQKVIELSGRNILVSAAAGSGKTAVLVERIIRMITDPVHPVDLDRLLVVTFTNAAAAQMRERIEKRLDEMIRDNPARRELRRQKALLPKAQICTIDSFCLTLLRSYFYQIPLDPSFRIADEGELLLMKEDVMDDLFNAYYEEGDEDFLNLIRSFSSARAGAGSDENIRRMTDQLFTLSESAPWQDAWLSGCADVYHIQTEEELNDSAFMKYLIRKVQDTVQDLLVLNDEILSVCRKENGPASFETAVLSDRSFLENLLTCHSYREFYDAFSSLKFQSKPRKKKADQVDPALEEEAKRLRDEEKDQLNTFKKKIFVKPVEEVLEELSLCRPYADMLIRLAKDFASRFKKAKREKNLVDFSDIEHMALQILTEEDHKTPSETALYYQDLFEEILVDEYQDSNDVQETILNMMTRERRDTPNLFMVGDVKQSIYAFRLAKPELFMEKYRTYSREDSLYQKIELQKNFRSRTEIVDSVNFLFHQLMREDLGHIDYGKEAALYPGADYESLPGKEDPYQTEIDLLNLSGEPPFPDMGETEEEEEDPVSRSEREWEAALCAQKILNLTGDDGICVQDEETKEMRPARPGDIVILLRSVSGWAATFVNVLASYGISARAESGNGYFSAQEVQVMLDLLSVLDNPAQDIPLAAVLHSPIGGMTSEELALVKNNANGLSSDTGFYGALLLYQEEGKEAETVKKVDKFLDFLEKYRKRAVFLSLPELLYELYDETGYYNYVSAMPAGAKRKANLDMLMEKAMAFEKTSYSGLFQFVRYIDKLKKYQVDFGEAVVEEELNDTVRIMSIHKSKGLEFPIVILAGCGKNFNKSDQKSQTVMRSDLGIGMNYIDPVLRERKKTLVRQVLSMRTEEEMMGEELRILYVAVTRAKEKLIVTGAKKDAHESLRAAMQTAKPGCDALRYGIRSGAKSFLDWILAGLLRHPSAAYAYEKEGMLFPSEKIKGEEDSFWNPASFDGFLILTTDPSDIVLARERDLAEKSALKEALKEIPSHVQQSEVEEVDRLFAFPYRYGPESSMEAVMSVSEIKRTEESLLLEEEGSLQEFSSRSGSDRSAAAKRGTAVHKILEKISFAEDVRFDGEMERIGKQEFPGEKRDPAAERELAAFMKSPLAFRMKRAEKEGNLFREQLFVAGFTPEELQMLTGSGMDQEKTQVRYTGERILVQGICDAWFYEDDGIVLIDYKTDRVSETGGEEVLAERYRMQLFLYKKALEMLTGKKVKETILYSLCLGKEIHPADFSA